MRGRPNRLRARQHLGQYRIVRWLASGSYGEVYHAVDTIRGLPCALKIPHPFLIDEELLAEFKREVRLTARLEHPGILPVMNASVIDGTFVMVTPLGKGTLADRLRMRLSARTALGFAEQILEALAFAHQKRVVHCDVKPDNFILFPENRLRLTDFGIAKTMLHTLRGSGRGTVGYLAPEQAMGRPSARSDVFSAGLILYRLFSGKLPEWPYDWPPPGFDRVRRLLGPEMIAVLRRSLEVSARKRYANAGAFLAAYNRIRKRALRAGRPRRKSRKDDRNRKDWKTVRRSEFLRRFGRRLETRHRCPRCDSPVSEIMIACPWCGKDRKTHRGDHRFPARCPRCRRGTKRDWHFCPWCYGGAIGPRSNRSYSDKRYDSRCANPQCVEKDLMPFMRYCPWCRRKVRRPWKIEGAKDSCPKCRWGVLKGYWSFCPWCSAGLSR